VRLSAPSDNASRRPPSRTRPWPPEDTAIPFGITLAKKPQEPAMAKILFVDDARDSADTLATFFKLLGHETEVAYDGDSAVEITTRFRPDIAFIDLQMPMLDGFDTAREFRSRLGDKPVLIALTGQEWERTDDDADRAGFDGYLQKPAQASTLAKLVNHLAA
jgi:CheY-like chemotaxis protein